MKKKKTNKAAKRMNRYFLVTKVFLAMTPIICYFYVSMSAMMQSVDFKSILETQPSLAVIFLIAMINPYIAYLVHLIQKKLNQGDTRFAIINMGLLLIAQALTLNVFYFMMLLYVFYKAVCVYHIQVKASITSAGFKQFVYNGGGSFFVIMISSVCLFATIRLM